MRPNCVFCGKPATPNKPSLVNGQMLYSRMCSSCAKHPYRRLKKKICEECGFKPVHCCQLTVDHKDGNKDNDEPINLQTLCHNCHALKTHLYDTPRVVQKIKKRAYE